MNILVEVKNQKEFMDAILDGNIAICVGGSYELKCGGYAAPHVVLKENAFLQVVAQDCSQPLVEAFGSSQPKVEAWGLKFAGSGGYFCKVESLDHVIAAFEEI